MAGKNLGCLSLGLLWVVTIMNILMSVCALKYFSCGIAMFESLGIPRPPEQEHPLPLSSHSCVMASPCGLNFPDDGESV